MKECIKNMLLNIRHIPFVNKHIYNLSQDYIDAYRHYSYDPATNGEEAIIRKLRHIFDGKFIFFDVGANIGDWTAYTITHLNNYQGHLFELSPETFTTLKKNVKDKKNLTLNNVGLSDKNTKIEFKNYGKDNGGNTTLINADYHNVPYVLTQAEIVKGDTYCKNNDITRINFMKIDTEGAEYFVLKGFNTSLKKKAIDIIQFEYGYTHGDANTLMRDFYTLLTSQGYCIGRLTPSGVQFKDFTYTDNDFKSGPNYIACLPDFKETLAAF